MQGEKDKGSTYTALDLEDAIELRDGLCKFIEENKEEEEVGRDVKT